MCSISVIRFVVLRVPLMMNDALVLFPDIDRAVVSMILTRNEIYLALLDKRHAVDVGYDVVVAHSNCVRNHLAIHSHSALHILRFVANRTSAIHDYTSIRRYSFLAALHQTRTHNIVNNLSNAIRFKMLKKKRRKKNRISTWHTCRMWIITKLFWTLEGVGRC